MPGWRRAALGLWSCHVSFFGKGWTNYELDGLVTRTMTGEAATAEWGPMTHTFLTGLCLGLRYGPVLSNISSLRESQAHLFNKGIFLRPPRARPNQGILLGAAVCVLIAVLALLLSDQRPTLERKPRSETLSAPLVLQAEQRSGGLLVTWDRSSDVLRQATGGVLSINSGRYRKDLRLNVYELRSERILFVTESSQTQFRLTVYLAKGAPVYEALLAVNTVSAAPPIAAQLPESIAPIRRHSARNVKRYVRRSHRPANINLPAPNTSDSAPVLVPQP